MIVVIVQLVNGVQTAYFFTSIESERAKKEFGVYFYRSLYERWCLVSANAACMLMMHITYVSAG